MENQTSQWVKVSKAAAMLPISTSLVYKWKHRGEHKNLFSKVGGSLFIDVAGVQRLIDSARLDAANN
jgi:hypothetical protein